MRDIIKSQLYQLKKNKLAAIVFIGLAAVLTAMVFMLVGLNDDKSLNAGCYYFAFYLSVTNTCSMMFSVVAVGEMCAGDFTDKTANYELMSGHTRKEVYFGRVIPCLAVGTLGSFFLVLLPLIITTAVYGWGTKLSAGAAALRLGLMLFPIIRIVCEFIFITFVVKNPYAVMGIGYLTLMLGQSDPLLQSDSVLLGVTNIGFLSRVDSYYVYGLNGEVHFIFDGSLGLSEIIGTIAASVIVGGLAIYMGYVFFGKDDLN